MRGIQAAIAGYRVQMDQPITPSLVKALLAEEDRANRLWMLLEIVGERRESLPLITVFPYLGGLRDDLHGLVESGLFEQEPASPAQKARDLLTIWSEEIEGKIPIDAPIVAVKMSIAAPTEQEVCRE